MKKHKDELDLKISAVMKKNLSKVSASDELILQTLQRIHEEQDSKNGVSVTPLGKGKAKTSRLPAALVSGIAAALIAIVGVGIVFTKMKTNDTPVTVNDKPKITQSIDEPVVETKGVEVISADYYNEDSVPVGQTVSGLALRAGHFSIGHDSIFMIKDSYFSGLTTFYSTLKDKEFLVDYYQDLDSSNHVDAMNQNER